MSERDNFMIYAGLINALIDHIENDVKKSVFNKQSLKYKSNGVLGDLIKLESKIFSFSKNSDAVTDQYIEAGRTMLNFYRLGLEMSDMNKIKSQGLKTQMNILLKTYGLNFEL